MIEISPGPSLGQCGPAPERLAVSANRGSSTHHELGVWVRGLFNDFHVKEIAKTKASTTSPIVTNAERHSRLAYSLFLPRYWRVVCIYPSSPDQPCAQVRKSDLISR